MVRAIRQRLSVFASAWLICQATVLIAAPASICISRGEAAGDVSCRDTCDHGTQCPMHHSTSQDSTSTCSCRSATDTDAETALFGSLFGPSAVLSTGIRAVAPLTPTEAAPLPAASLIDTPTLPDAPPPRR